MLFKQNNDIVYNTIMLFTTTQWYCLQQHNDIFTTTQWYCLQRNNVVYNTIMLFTQHNDIVYNTIMLFTTTQWYCLQQHNNVVYNNTSMLFTTTPHKSVSILLILHRKMVQKEPLWWYSCRAETRLGGRRQGHHLRRLVCKWTLGASQVLPDTDFRPTR